MTVRRFGQFVAPIAVSAMAVLAMTAQLRAMEETELLPTRQLPRWVQAYPELRAGGCLWYVGAWSDGSFTSVPFDCPPEAMAYRGDEPAPALEEVYPEADPSGCTWLVARWSDGVYNRTPFACADGQRLTPAPPPRVESP